MASSNSSIVVASSVGELEALSKRIANSSLIPVAFRSKPDDCYVAMLMGNELGLAPIQAINNIDVVEGRPQVRARLKQSLAQRHPDCEFFMLVESTDEKATYETKRRGHPKSVRLSYTIEQATKAGLTRKANYQGHPAAMLRARASSALADAVYPEATLGLPTDDYSPEELSRMEDAAGSGSEVIDITPQPSAQAQEEKKPSRVEEVKAALAAKKAEEKVEVVEFKPDPKPSDPKPPEPKPTPKPPEQKADAKPEQKAPEQDWWAKAQVLAKLRGISGPELKAQLKSLGAAGPKSITAEIYAKLEAAYPVAGAPQQTQAAKDGDLF